MGKLAFLSILTAFLFLGLGKPAQPADTFVRPEAFAGSWEGTLRNGRPSWLIVEKITGDGGATVVYGLAKWGRFRAVDQRQFGAIQNGVLEFTLNNGAELTYRMLPDHSLEVLWLRDGRTGQWLMTKAAGAPKKVASLDDCTDPLPNVIVIPPDSSVPQTYAKFSGIWRGRWNGNRCSSLAVDLVEASGKVRYVYSWSKRRNRKGGYRSGYGRIVDGKLKFGENVKYTFWLATDGAMRGEAQAGRLAKIKMEKIDPR